jgi:hypothetical protein
LEGVPVTEIMTEKTQDSTDLLLTFNLHFSPKSRLKILCEANNKNYPLKLTFGADSSFIQSMAYVMLLNNYSSLILTEKQL